MISDSFVGFHSPFLGEILSDTDSYIDPEPDIDEKQDLPLSTAIQPVSEEQNHIIKLVLQGNNVIVDACAGSGKSTTILSAAIRAPHLRFLQLTYNSELRKDVKKKIGELGLSNIQVHTYHSLAVRYYLVNARTDTEIRKILYNHIPPREPIPSFDIIVLDETQDATMLYFQWMVKFTLDMGSPFQLFILGDFMQCLYQFKGADYRFLTLSESCWNTHPLLKTQVFSHCTLKTSYRITNQMSAFVNDVMLGYTRLETCRDGVNVKYMRNSRSNLERFVIFHIKHLLENGYSPEDIFVLGASVKSAKSVVRKMENALVERNIPCYVPLFETDAMDERVIQKKVVFSTFHSVKGRQRKHVFVVGFDNSYFRYYAANLSPDVCPNTLYVGCTRATERLFLLENDNYDTDRPLSFLKKTHFEMKQHPAIDFSGIPRSLFADPEASKTNTENSPNHFHLISPTDLIKFLPETVIESIAVLLDKIFIHETPQLTEMDEIPIPNVAETSGGLVEDVSDINGVAIPAIYYDFLYNKYHRSSTENEAETNVEPSEQQTLNDVLMGDKDEDSIHSGWFSSGSKYGAQILHQSIQENMENSKENDHSFLRRLIREMPTECNHYGDYLYLSNLYIASNEKLCFRINQIQKNDYTWLSDAIVKKCLRRLDRTIGKECRDQPPLVEYTFITPDMEEENKKINDALKPFMADYTTPFRFHARPDCITSKSIFELKCTVSTTIEHKLQLVIYDWLWHIIHDTRETKKTHKKYIRKSGKSKISRLYNFKTGHMYRLEASFAELTQIMVAMLRSKYKEYIPPSDDTLITECVSYIKKCVSDTKELTIYMDE
jgi:hypothetical protein